MFGTGVRAFLVVRVGVLLKIEDIEDLKAEVEHLSFFFDIADIELFLEIEEFELFILEKCMDGLVVEGDFLE